MEIRRIGSTEAQNNFGRIMDSVTKDHVGFVIERRSVPEVWVISNSDLRDILSNSAQRKEIEKLLKNISSRNDLGETISTNSK
jgi:Phd_YefM.